MCARASVRACKCVCARERVPVNVHARVCIPCTDTPAPHVALHCHHRPVSFHRLLCVSRATKTDPTDIDIIQRRYASDSTRLVLPLQTKSRSVYSLVFKSDNTQLYTINTNQK